MNVLERLKEPSTWRGIVIVFGAVGITITPDMQEVIMLLVAGVYGAIQIFRQEKTYKVPDHLQPKE